MNHFVNDLDLMESVFDNKLMKLNYQFDKCMMEHEENIRLIESKILFENGTYDDLYKLYTYEAGEANEKSVSVLRSIINAVKNFFRKLRNILFGEKIDENSIKSDIEVSENPDKVLKDGNNTLARIKAFIKGHSKQLATGAVVTAATAGAFIIAKNKVIPYVKSMNQFMEDSEKVLNDASDPNLTKNLTAEEQDGLKKAVNDAKRSGSKISQIMKKIRTTAGINEDDYEYNKSQRIVETAKKTREHIDNTIETLRSKNDEDEVALKQIREQVKKIEAKSGIRKSFMNGIFNKHHKDGKKIETLKRRIDSGNYSDHDLDEYTDLLRRYGEDSAKYSTDIKNATDEIRKIEQRIQSRSKKMGSLNTKREKTMKSQREAAERGADIINRKNQENASVTNESTVLVESTNSEIDYFINSLL